MPREGISRTLSWRRIFYRRLLHTRSPNRLSHLQENVHRQSCTHTRTSGIPASCGLPVTTLQYPAAISSRLADLFRSQAWVFAGAMVDSPAALHVSVCVLTRGPRAISELIDDLERNPPRRSAHMHHRRQVRASSRASETGGASEEGGCLQ